MKRLITALGLAALSCSLAAPPTTSAAKLTLMPSYAGAVLQGRIYAPGNDALVGVWSGAGFSRLLKCTPRCNAVKTLPVPNTLVIGSASTYRVALGGNYTTGQKVTLTLRFQNQGVLNVHATVTRP